jgi:Ni/Co efflux regulator RcnB
MRLKERNLMKMRFTGLTCLTVLFAFSGSGAFAQQNRSDQSRGEHSQFDSHDQQVTRDWYGQHHDNAPAGLRDKDRLPPEKESQLRKGEVVPRDLQKQEHPIPRDLSRQLPPPPHDSRYVAVGGHVAQVDHQHRLQDIIHLELNIK